MAAWHQFETETAAMAGEVRRVFEAASGHVLATLRQNGAPKVSGIEVQFEDGEMTFGSMTKAVKVLDLQRDGRFALHSNPAEGDDAKLSGLAVEVSGLPEHDSHLFRLDLDLAVCTAIGDDGKHLLIQIWRPGEPVRAVKRY